MLCVSFDADGTLLDFNHTMRVALETSLAEIREAAPGPGADGLTVDRLITMRDEVARELPGASMERIRLLAFGRVLAEIGVPDRTLAERLTARYLKRRFDLTRLYPDTLPTLAALAGRYRLGLASNGNSYPERSGLAGCFGFAVLSQDAGISKPDPRFYRAVLEAASVPPGQLVHVGDSLVHDVGGPQAVGIRAIWLNRSGASNDTSVHPDGEIRLLTELPALLATLWS